jgi:hypothetical protein
MEQFITEVIAIVIGAIVVYWLGIGSVRVVVAHGTRINKKWKWVILISWLMIISGIYIFLINFPNGGLYNPYVGMGFSLASLGLIGLGIGRLGSWWNRP